MQPLITQEGAIQEIPAGGSGDLPAGVGALISSPGLQGAAFGAEAGYSYLIDPTIETTATLLDGTADGQLVEFQPVTGLGGALLVNGSLQSGAALGMVYGNAFQTLGPLRFRWNAGAAKWMPYGVSLFGLICSTPLAGPFVLGFGGGLAIPVELTEGSMLARPRGSAAMEAVPYPPPMSLGPELIDEPPTQQVMLANHVAWSTATALNTLQARFPALAECADGDTCGFKNLDQPGTVGFLTAPDGATFEHPQTGAMVAAPGVNIVFAQTRANVIWKRYGGNWYIDRVSRAA